MGLLQQAVTWYMLEGKLPTGTSKTKRLHQDKFEFSLFSMSQWGQLALQHVPCNRSLQKAHNQIQRFVLEREHTTVNISISSLT